MFTVFGIGVYYWFYRFTTDKTLQRLKDDLRISAIASSQQIDVDEFVTLSQTGKANQEGGSDDPLYQKQLEWLYNLHQINPKIFIFTFIKDDSQTQEKQQIRYLVDVWMNIDASKSARFLESAIATPYHINTLTNGTVEFRDFYQDKWGKWMTYYAPIRDKSGKIVGAIGADMQIDEITQLQKEIQRQFLVSFGISYPFFLTLIYILTTLLTRRFQAMQKYAQAVGEGNYQPNISLSSEFKFSFFNDERIILSKALEEMTGKIRQREELLNAIFNQVAVGIGIHTLDHKIKIVNQTFCRLIGYSEEELIDRHCCDITHPEDIELSKKYIHEMIHSKVFPPSTHEKRCICKNGEIIWIEMAITIIEDNHKNPKYFISVIQDITRRRFAEKKLIEAANTDFLTKLPNRGYFIECLDDLLSQANDYLHNLFALLLVDLDNFKTINDSLGHLAGDQFLVNIANHLSDCVTDKDIVARLGGDEFAILLTSIQSIEDAIVVANKIQTEISIPFYIHGQEFVTSASIGIVLSRNLASQTKYLVASDLLRDADIAMYQVKNKGKNNYAIFGQEMYENFIHQLKLENDLRKAIGEGSLSLYYQPIIDLKTGELYSLESLVRWFHPELGFLTPNKFLPIAEQSGLIVELGNWGLKTACHQLHQWHEEKLISENISVNVNIAGKQFDGKDLLTQIVKTLSETKLSPSHLHIEVTETIISHNTVNVTKTLKKIKDLGVKIAIDDFGTGYSSLARLRNFPVNEIKIDKAFVQPLNTHPRNVKFLQGIITLCQNLELKVVCEGIETEAQNNILSDLHCNYGQGYLFAKPMSVSDFELWIKNKTKRDEERKKNQNSESNFIKGEL
ncbi:diguanylate cyclase/phosphodiesterase with PAS/PAC sensor [Geminocystis sp. NIES-3709]|nr:diguanylate cyclase/phosphodiesterase with PAS/PAC sensor [Geminocystis sp. NIES-3709]